MNDVLDTITTTDQNTGRQITWTIVASRKVGPNVARYGWTHSLVVTRPNGRKAHTMWAELIGDVVVRTSATTVAW